MPCSSHITYHSNQPEGGLEESKKYILEANDMVEELRGMPLSSDRESDRHGSKRREQAKII